MKERYNDDEYNKSKQSNEFRETIVWFGSFVTIIFAALYGVHLLKDTGPADCPDVGDRCADGTIYAGTWEPENGDGTTLGVFNLFAAPQDLTDDQGNRLLLTFNDAVAHIAGLKDWHGHDGGRFENDAALYAAIGDGSYGGEWFIPPQDVLLGNLYPNRNAGALSGTFATEFDGFDFARWYWSCTEHRDFPSFVWLVRFSDGDVDWFSKDYEALSSRPVRAEPRP